MFDHAVNAMITSFTAQLASLSDTLKATDTLIQRLSTLTFQPGSESLSTDSTSVRVELAQDIHESLKQLGEDLELLKQEAEDLHTIPSSHTVSSSLTRSRRESVTDSRQDRLRLQTQLERLGEDLRSSRAHFRRAQLNAKKASELAKQREREAIFANLRHPPVPELAETNGAHERSGTPDLFAGRRTKHSIEQKSQEQAEVDASTSVTAALRRTHNLLSTELSRSRFAQETFDQSTAALAELGEKYDSLDSVLKNSRELLGTLLRSQKSDTWYLETAFYILITTLVWLVFRRLLLGPFIRLPLFFLNWFIWKPVAGFLYLTGILGTAGSQALTSEAARAPLIVQPSAAGRGGIPRFDESMSDQTRQQAGGSQAKRGKDADPAPDGVLRGEMSERIAKMAQERNEHEEGRRRGDGTLLEERDNVQPNRKKKMFEADVEDEKYKAQQEEVAQSRQGEEHDEL